MSDMELAARHAASDVERFARLGGNLKLRRYQETVARRVADSALNRKGLSFVVMFPRQSGKNETQAQIEAFLLARFSQVGGELVKVSPTWKPQSLNAMERLERALVHNFLTERLWTKEWGYVYRVGKARAVFLSGSRTANIVGATASILLEVDEAQDIEIDKYDKEIAPMAASTNATRVFWGTAWTSETLLARELEVGRRLEAEDGVQRVFWLEAEAVSREVPEYGQFVEAQVRKLGRNHPMVRSQFFSEAVDAAGRLFPHERMALMQGVHAPLKGPEAGEVYALLVDVAGAEECGEKVADEFGGRRDSTVVTVVRVRTGLECEQAEVEEALADGDVFLGLGLEADAVPAAGLSGRRGTRYEVVNRYAWVGMKQAQLFGEIERLAVLWKAWRLVVDATGVGAGLASFLAERFPTETLPVTFSMQRKSQLGWDFLAIVETRRFREYAPVDTVEWAREASLQDRFWREVRLCEGRALPGPAKTLQWGVPEGRRDGASGEYVHDDLLVSAALCARLEGEVVTRAESVVIPPDESRWGWKW